jgi:glucuronate isomerase
MVTETAGFHNTVGFNDDTRAFCSIPARRDVARRVDCACLVATGRLAEDQAFEVAHDQGSLQDPIRPLNLGSKFMGVEAFETVLIPLPESEGA